MMDEPIASSMGLLSGCTYAQAEAPEFAAQLYNDPGGFIGGIYDLVQTLSQEPGLSMT